MYKTSRCCPSSSRRNGEGIYWLHGGLGDDFFKCIPRHTWSWHHIIHLEALSCVKHISFSANDLKALLANKNQGVFDWDDFATSDLGKYILQMWNKPNVGLTGITLTSVGMLVGVYVSDLLTKTRTDFGDL